ncbi:hypothetical protein OAO65_02230 [Flavobacteriales bacterium]|nr:hypothetical protein [Flavobacteriales bacterium]
MTQYFGDFAEDETLYIPFNTFSSDDPSASVTITNLADADIKVHKDGSVTQIVTDGATIAIDFDSITGNHLITIDTSVHADYTTGADYQVRIEGTTVDGATINAWVGSFSIENRHSAGALRPTTAGRTLDVTATGAAGIDWGNIENKTTANDLSGTDIQLVDTVTTVTGGATAAELAKVPKSDGTASWNATALGAINAECDTALTDYDAPTNTELNARTLASADYFDPAADTVATVTTVTNQLTGAAIADSVWDEALSGHQTGGTAGRSLTLAGTILSETTLTGTPTTTTMQLTAGSTVDDFYNDMELVIIDGTQAGLSRIITDYTGSTKLVTFDEALTGAPSSGDAVIVRASHRHSKSQIADAVWDEDIVASHTTADTAGAILEATSNLAVGAGGISVTAGSATVTTGSETLTYTSTQELDGTTHDVADAAGSTEFYYEFDVGVTGVGTEIIWDGHAESNGDSYTIKAYEWVAAAFKTIGTITASNSTAAIERVFILTSTMTGSGANAGTVRWQVTSADGTNFSTDRILCEYTALPEARSILHSGIAQSGTTNTIVLDTGANATDDFYNHARVVISSGTGSEQERIIVDYVGSTKTATIAPPWVTNPDSTSAFEVEPALAHAETGWATIKVGLAAAATSTTITLDSSASAVDDYYNSDTIKIDAGTGDGQVRYITDYVGSTKVATINPAWVTTPDTTSEYIVEDGAHADVVAIDGNHTSAVNLAASTLGVETGACEGTPSTTVVQTDLGEATDDHYIGRVIVFTSGSAAGQASDITDYTGSTGTVTITAITTAPAAADTFVIV